MKMPDLVLPAGIQACFAESPQEVAERLADTVSEFLQTRLKAAPRASLAVSGGSTPAPFFRALSVKNLDWARVDIVLVDERWVDEADPASNTRLVKETLLQNQAAAARFFSLKQPGKSPEEGLDATEAEIAELTQPLDVLVLGMGSDGHTASLFPDAPGIKAAMDPVNRQSLAAMAPLSQAQPRITLTYAMMHTARLAILHLKGDDKMETLKRALEQQDDLLAMPVRGFLKPGLSIFWSP